MMNDTDITQDTFDCMEEFLNETESLTPIIREGDIRCLKRIPVEKYWENANQISKPASNKRIQEYLSIPDDAPLTLKKRLLIVFGVAFVLMLIRL